MKRLGVRRESLAAAAVVLALLAAGGALSFAVAAGAAPQGALQETTVPSPTDTGPTPDPAPKPTPKPGPKPAPTTHRTYTAPRTHSAPTRTYSAPTYTRPTATATHSSKPRVTTHNTVHKKKPAAKKPAVTTSTPAEPTPQPAALIPVGAKQVRSSSKGDHAITSVLFVAGVTFAALLFLLAAAVPGTPVRFTPVGRVVFEHQQDLVLVGLAAFIITVFVYVLTGHGL